MSEPDQPGPAHSPMGASGSRTSLPPVHSPMIAGSLLSHYTPPPGTPGCSCGGGAASGTGLSKQLSQQSQRAGVGVHGQVCAPLQPGGRGASATDSSEPVPMSLHRRGTLQGALTSHSLCPGAAGGEATEHGFSGQVSRSGPALLRDHLSHITASITHAQQLGIGKAYQGAGSPVAAPGRPGIRLEPHPQPSQA